MKKDYKIIFSPKFHLIIIGLIVFQFFILNSFLNPQDFFTICLISELMIIGMPLVTEFYKKFNQKFFLQSNQLKEKSKIKVKIISFLIVFTCLWIVVIYHFAINYLFQDVLKISSSNVVGNNELIDYSSLMRFSALGPLLFFIFMTIVSIILTTYFLSHFISNKIYIYGVLIAFLVAEIIFGPIFNRNLFELDYVNGEYYIVNGNHLGSSFTILTLIVIPWNYFTFMIDLIIKNTLQIIEMKFNHFWNTLYLENCFKFLIWFTYTITFLCGALPFFINFFKRKNI